MGQLPARSNAQGTRTYHEYVEYWHQVSNQGIDYPPSIYTWHNLPVHTCRKVGTKGYRGVIPGTRTVFRYPTTFARGVTEYTWGKADWIARDPGNPTYVRRLEAAFPNDDGNQYRRPAVFDWGGAHNAGPPELEYEAIAKALAKIRDQAIGFGEHLAQMKQATNMIADNGITLLEACLAVRRGNIRKAWDLLRDNRSVVTRGADLYLQYRYGWKPLMTDIYKSAELAKDLGKEALIFSGKAKSQRQSINFYGPNDPNRTVTGSGHHQAFVKLFGKLNGDYSRNLDRMGLANPLRLAWDLVPLSFVVDWFAPVGPVLDSLIPPKGVDFVAGFCTVQCEMDCKSVLRPSGNITGEPVENRFRCFGMDRRTYDGWPRAGLYMTKDPFGLSKGAAAIALAIQRLAGLKR